MTAKLESRKGVKMEWLPPLFKAYIYSTAALLGAIGVMLFLITWTCKVRGIQPYLNEPAPLFGLANRTVLLLAGVLHLAFGVCLLAMRDLISQGLLVQWAGLNCFLYRMAMVWMAGMRTPYPMENFVGWRLGAKPETVDLCWNIFIAYLILGSSVLMLAKVLLKWWQSKQLKEEAWFKHWQETRDQDRPKAKPVIQKPPANATDYLKISCPHCSGHIEFPVHALGQQIQCPHCAKTIALLEPANPKTESSTLNPQPSTRLL